jgi:hypothetical protein
VSVEQVKGCEPDPRCEALDAAEREVAFAPLDGTQVGAVHAEQVRERLLGQPALDPLGAEVGAKSPLQVAFHRDDADRSLLNDLQTDQ